MRISKILVPIDFSASSAAAVDCASMLAAGAQAPLVFVHVVVPAADFAASPESAEGQPYSLPSQQDPDAAQLDRIRPSAADVRYTHKLLSGDPAHEIVALAATEQVDLIVMGSHGHTGLARLLLGSVAEAVIRRAHCPVLVLRLPSGKTGDA